MKEHVQLKIVSDPIEGITFYVDGEKVQHFSLGKEWAAECTMINPKLQPPQDEAYFIAPEESAKIVMTKE